MVGEMRQHDGKKFQEKIMRVSLENGKCRVVISATRKLLGISEYLGKMLLSFKYLPSYLFFFFFLISLSYCFNFFPGLSELEYSK